MVRMIAEVMKKMSTNSKWKKLLGKKWTFPAIYMTVAALILTLMWWYQGGQNAQLTKEDLGLQQTINEEVAQNEEAVPVTAQTEQMMWPVQNADKAEVKMEFFDLTRTEEEMQKAIVKFQNEIWPHTGIDIVSKDNSTLTIVAALSGEVVRAEKDPVVGYMVDIKHENGLVTNYSSLSELKVAKGDKVSQGQILGAAGRNIFEKEQGIHLHFEVRNNNETLSPTAFFGQDASQVIKQLEAKATAAQEQDDQEPVTTDEKDPATTDQAPEQKAEPQQDKATDQPAKEDPAKQEPTKEAPQTNDLKSKLKTN